MQISTSVGVVQDILISSTLRYLLWRGERYAHRIRDLSLYPSIHGTHGDVFNWDASKFGRLRRKTLCIRDLRSDLRWEHAMGLSGGAILPSMLVSSISLSCPGMQFTTGRRTPENNFSPACGNLRGRAWIR